jgi:D-allose transport system ATP-binding protein
MATNERATRPLVEMKGIVKTFGGIHALEGVNLDIYPGEVHVILGENGAGKSTLMKILSGIYQPSAGEIIVDGHAHTHMTPTQAAQFGISIIYQELSDAAIAEDQRKLLRIKCSSTEQNITELSGGNQQKVLVGKWMCTAPEVFIFDEPTRGIDVGAKSEIYKIMRDLSDEGKAIIMVSSELPEILAVCDRVAVFHSGSIAGILDGATASEEQILSLAISGKGE